MCQLWQADAGRLFHSVVAVHPVSEVVEEASRAEGVEEAEYMLVMVCTVASHQKTVSDK